MKGLGSRWAGRAYGTNTGNLFVEFDAGAEQPRGVLRFNDSDLGLATFAVEGRFVSGKIELQGVPTPAPTPAQPAELGNLTITGRLDPRGQIVGDWSSTLGAAGTFVLFPHDRAQEDREQIDAPPAQEQLYTAVRKVGALRLYAEDVRLLFDVIRRDFGQSARVVVTYRAGGTEISRYADDFAREFEQIGALNYLKMSISEPEILGLNKTATVELNGAGENLVTTQSAQASWAVGKAEGVSIFLKKCEKPLANSFRQFGLNFNALILLASLAALPDLEILQRFLFLATVVALTQLLAWIHRRHIPNAAIFLREKKPGWVERSAPQIVSWLVAATSAVVASIVYGLMKGEISFSMISLNIGRIIH